MSDPVTNLDQPHRIAFIGSYLPRRCGIATFTADLSNAVATEAPHADVWNVAMNDRPQGYRYPQSVKFEIDDRRKADYRLAADFLKAGRVDVVSLQHEYGIFGGQDGGHIFWLLERLNIPIVPTLHTVLKDPTEGQRRVMLRLVELSDRVVVLAERAVRFLTEIYEVPCEKIVHIPHGIPDTPFIDPNFYKDKFNVEGRKVILTFRLLRPRKGIENMIDALPRVVKAHPDAAYIVLGATHPHVQASFGEDYRTSLQRRAEKLGVADHVIFHNRFVALGELCEFLGAADVYVTPYLNEAQICSGTLAYAMGTGNALVSTPYWYAQEMLGDDRGRLVPFQNVDALADAVIDLFDHESTRHAIRKAAYNYTRPFVWSRVARQYLDLFKMLTNDRSVHPHPIHSEADWRGRELVTVGSRGARADTTELPEIRLDHLRALTDDTGIFQHARGQIPNRYHGYCTDDNARALIAVLMARDQLESGAGCTQLARCYLSFLHYAFDQESGRFRNFMSYDRRWAEEAGSEDAHGRAVWALGETVARAESAGHLNPATELFRQAIEAIPTFTSPRAWAYGLIGLHAYLRRYGGDTGVKRVRAELADKLLASWHNYCDESWPWFEHSLTYANARLAQALLLSGRWMFHDEMVAVALRALDWLVSIQTAEEGHFSPVGCDGWFVRNGARARFDQQPLEAHGVIDACLEAYRVTGEQRWHDRAMRVFRWFLGDNDIRMPLFDPVTGGCHDALHPRGVNENQGAESTLSWLMSLLAMYDSLQDTGERSAPSAEAATRIETTIASARDSVGV